jgi:hypothetical protein
LAARRLRRPPSHDPREDSRLKYLILYRVYEASAVSAKLFAHFFSDGAFKFEAKPKHSRNRSGRLLWLGREAICSLIEARFPGGLFPVRSESIGTVVHRHWDVRAIGPAKARS